MSRLIVKNLPKQVSSKKLHDLFSTKGCVTDLQLKYNDCGTFRNFAFVGYKTEEEAIAAQQYFHNTFIDTSKIHVEVCASLGDVNKPRAWSKYTKEKLKKIVDEKTEAEQSDEKNEQKKKKKKDKSKEKDNDTKLDAFPDELKNDTLFAEFLDVNKARKSKPLWSDAPLESKDNDDEEEEDSGDNKSFSDGSESENEEISIAKKADVSDMDYLKSKMKGSSITSEKTDQSPKDNDKNISNQQVDKPRDSHFTVKLRNLPFHCNKKKIKQFFHPLKCASIRIPQKSRGFAYARFKTDKDVKSALTKHKDIIDGHKVDVVKFERKESGKTNKHQFDKQDKEKIGEELFETGRLFVRNLWFKVTEEELQNLFSKYGPISEIHLPIDSYTKKTLGFAFVSFLFPEHAVKAFIELDGAIFQGRVLHIIPAKPKIETSLDENDLSYKKKKEAKLKALSGSSHNWNVLFLGLNAVADAISKKYDVDKSELLNDESKESIAVRMALGETQLVIETRKFLLENGVQLDAFSQAACERSKNVIIAKNLPVKTSPKEIMDLFSKHGTVSRVILPPSGITALIEFQEPTEAKLAFKRLAYTRFHYMPLYLEWAPINVFIENPQPKTTDISKVDESGIIEQNTSNDQLVKSEKSSEVGKDEEDEDELEPESGTVLFVKNINFETTEEDFKRHFKKCGAIHSSCISKKKDLNTGKLLSMGFGFIHFKKKASATRALNDLQYSMLDGYRLELKFSNKATIQKADTHRKKAQVQKQKTSKILVRNIPFEVTEREIRDLFKEFGMLKSVRLPKKPTGEGSHRGFGFVDFTTKSDAKKAFDALCHSTHLLGRRLVLEWANPEAEEVSELRKKTARDFYAGGPKTKLKKSKLLQDVAMAKVVEDQEDVEEE